MNVGEYLIALGSSKGTYNGGTRGTVTGRMGERVTEDDALPPEVPLLIYTGRPPESGNYVGIPPPQQQNWELGSRDIECLPGCIPNFYCNIQKNFMSISCTLAQQQPKLVLHTPNPL